MKKIIMILTCTAIAGLAQAGIVQFRAWDPGATGMTTKTYSITNTDNSYGELFTFELTVTAANGFIAGNTGRLGVDPVGGNVGSTIGSPEFISFSLNVIAPVGYNLSALSLSAINTEAMDAKSYLYTDHLGASTTYDNSTSGLANVPLDYDNEMAGIAALSVGNLML